MLDIKYIRENPDEVKARLLTRGKDFSEQIDLLIKLEDVYKRQLQDLLS